MKRKHPDAMCEVCPLQGNRFVKNWGNDSSDIAFVGKNPSTYDGNQGYAFSGESGIILKGILKGLGHKPEQMFFTNLVMCAGKGATSLAAIKACAPRLQKQLKSKETIVTLGDIHNFFKVNDKSISEARLGAPKPMQGKKIIPTYQPAALLWNANLFPDLVTDLKKINQDPVEWKAPEYKVIKGLGTAVKYLNMIPNGIKIAIDIETEKDKDVQTYNPTKKDLLCIGLAASPDKVIILGKELFKGGGSTELKRALRKVLENNKIIAHNGKFDLNGVTEFIGYDHKAVLWFDTMLASYALDERPGTNGLGFLSRDILWSPNWKKNVKKKNLAVIPEEELYEYNAYDVANTFALYQHFEAKLKKQKLEDLFRFLMRSSDTLMKIERNGVAVDIPYLHKLKRIYTKKQGILLKSMQGLVRDPNFNPNSHIQVKKYFSSKNIAIANTQAGTIEKFLDHPVMGPYAERHLKFKKGNKTLSTYVNGMLNREVDGIVYTVYKLHGTVTGRLSSSDPNLQNITRGFELRNIFAASPGHILIKADYSQAELRAMAWMAQDEYLREIFNSDGDIHGMTAENIFGPSWTKEHRQISKMIVYGLSYGMGARYLGHNINVSTEVAQEYIDEFFKMIPATKQWIDGIKTEILTKHKLVSPFGYVRRFPFINRVNRKKILKEGMSFLPQNIVSNMTLETANRMTEMGYGHMIRLLVHDEIVFEVPHSDYMFYARSIKTLMEEIGTKIFENYIPATVDLAIGYKWGECKETKVENGKDRDDWL